jgi:uncharacterized membrane protein YfcA
MTLLVMAFTIVLLAAATQAVTGFGYALVAVPLLAAATDPRTAVVACSLTGIGLTLTAVVRERAHARWRTAGMLLGAAVLGMPVGLLVLWAAPERALTALIAVVVLGCTLLVWRDLRIGTGAATVGVIGVLSGVLATATGMNGPPLVAAFQAMGYDPRTFRATLAAVFAGTGVLGLAGFALTGELTADAGAVAAAGMPAVLLGWWAGDRLFSRLDPVRFRRLVLCALLVSAAVTLGRAAVS